MAKHTEISISPNAEQADILVKALDSLDKSDKSNVTYQRLYKEVKTIQTIWQRRAKNETIVKTVAKATPKANRVVKKR